MYSPCVPVWLTMFQGFSPSKKQEQSLRSLFVASFPTSKPRTLYKPSPEDTNLLIFYERASQLVIPRRPPRILPKKSTMAKTTDTKKAKATKNAKGNDIVEEPVVAPPTPDPTSHDGSDAGTDESEHSEETVTVSNHGKQTSKAPVANMTSESTSNGTKRSRDGNEENSGKKKKKKTAAAPVTETTATVRPASCSEPMYVILPISYALPMGPR